MGVEANDPHRDLMFDASVSVELLNALIFCINFCEGNIDTLKAGT